MTGVPITTQHRSPAQLPYEHQPTKRALRTEPRPGTATRPHGTQEGGRTAGETRSAWPLAGSDKARPRRGSAGQAWREQYGGPQRRGGHQARLVRPPDIPVCSPEEQKAAQGTVGEGVMESTCRV